MWVNKQATMGGARECTGLSRKAARKRRAVARVWKPGLLEGHELAGVWRQSSC